MSAANGGALFATCALVWCSVQAATLPSASADAIPRFVIIRPLYLRAPRGSRGIRVPESTTMLTRVMPLVKTTT